MQHFVALPMPRLRDQIMQHTSSLRSASVLLVVVLVVTLVQVLCGWLCLSTPEITAFTGRAARIEAPTFGSPSPVTFPILPGMPGPAHGVLHHTCCQIGLPLTVMPLTLPLCILVLVCLSTRMPFNLRIAPIPPPPQLLYHSFWIDLATKSLFIHI